MFTTLEHLLYTWNKIRLYKICLNNRCDYFSHLISTLLVTYILAASIYWRPNKSFQKVFEIKQNEHSLNSTSQFSISVPAHWTTAMPPLQASTDLSWLWRTTQGNTPLWPILMVPARTDALWAVEDTNVQLAWHRTHGITKVPQLHHGGNKLLPFTMVVVVATATVDHRCTYNSIMVVATSTNYNPFTLVVVATATAIQQPLLQLHQPNGGGGCRPRPQPQQQSHLKSNTTSITSHQRSYEPSAAPSAIQCSR